MIEKIKTEMLKREDNLSPFAFKTKDAYRLKDEEEDIRPAFFRDSDRIIYSLSYTRYMNKTQVFSYVDNDHITKRKTHVEMVSKIARTIGRFLNLNEDLIEAISLGHDIGHTPLGHLGEMILDEISKKELNEVYQHNIQSVRNFMYLEKNGLGNNLTVQVLDGIMCHNGEIIENKYEPVKKTKEEFLAEFNGSYYDASLSKKMRPMTLEGCVVRISDVIAYIGKDIEDAIELNKIKRTDIPKKAVKVLGNNNKDIVNTLILDIIKESYNKPYIKMSKEVCQALEELKDFNYQNIYLKANTETTIKNYQEGFKFLFKVYLEDIKNKRVQSAIFKDYLNLMDDSYILNNNPKRIVIDYLAGMTDNYYKNQYEKCKQEREKLD